MIIKQSEAERLLNFAAFICLRNDGEMRELSMEEAVKKAEALGEKQGSAGGFLEAMTGGKDKKNK